MQNLLVRNYEINDNDDVRNLHEIALRATGAFIEHGVWDDDLKNINGVYLKPGGEFIVGTIDGKIVAMGALKKISDEIAEIKRMRVYPDYQRNGFGQMIYDELEQRARAKDFKKLVLDTTSPQKASQAFYLKNGFAETHRRTALDSMEFIYYEKILK